MTVATPRGKIFESDISDSEKEAIHERQERFLVAYAEQGTITNAATLANVHRDTVHAWRNEDRYSFRRRFENAQHVFREVKLERVMFDRISEPAGNRGSDILLIFALKAHWPERYRDDARPADDSAKEVLSKLMGWERKGSNGKGSH